MNKQNGLIHTIKQCLAVKGNEPLWRNPKNIMLNERSPTENIACYTIPLHEISRQDTRNRKKVRGCLGLEWEGALAVIEHINGSILKPSFRDGCTTA